MNFVLIDDEQFALDNLNETVLEVDTEAKTHCFMDAFAAFDYIMNNPVDVVISDVEMPGLKGIDLAKKIKVHRPTTNIIFATGYSQYAMIAMEMRCSGYIMKPVTPDKLQVELKNLRYPVFREIDLFDMQGLQTDGYTVGAGDPMETIYDGGAQNKDSLFGTGFADPGQQSFESAADMFGGDAANVAKGVPVTDKAAGEPSSGNAAGEPKAVERGTMRIRTFGNFEIYVNNKPVAFKYSVSKELIAFLVDRRGVMCTNGEIMSALWEDEDRSGYLRQIRKDIVDTLKKFGLDDIIFVQWGKMGIDRTKVECDLFMWEDGNLAAINSYHGEYMEQYSWAEYSKAAFEDI